jgi:malonyl CoA-acyl carrier protein transacylase
LRSRRATWLTGVTPRPPVADFASVPVSFPLIGLKQFTQYLVAARVSGLSPAELSARFSGVFGHSQGLVTAVAISSSKDDAS